MQRNSHLPSEQIDELPADSASVPEKSTFLERFLFLNFIFFAGFTFIAISSRRPAFIPRGLPFPFFVLSFFVLAWFFLLHSHNHSFNA